MVTQYGTKGQLSGRESWYNQTSGAAVPDKMQRESYTILTTEFGVVWCIFSSGPDCPRWQTATHPDHDTPE